MKQGVYKAKKKDGTIYYRSSITYQNKHISLGSFPCEEDAHLAYKEANNILFSTISLSKLLLSTFQKISFEKAIILMNYRDHNIYIGTPIYLQKNYFSYFLSSKEELIFDIDDLFYYSSHKILRRQGHLYVNDYGMQVSLLSRYGIKNYSVLGRDYYFSNQNPHDFRYSNIVIVNPYYGVYRYTKKNGQYRYRVKIHINGNYTIGSYSTETKAAIAYNKAVDLAKANGIHKNFSTNYIENISSKDYADLYLKIKISNKYLQYLKE